MADRDARRASAKSGARRWSATWPASKLPALVLKDLQGNNVDLRAERGNVVLLNFFSAW